MTMTVLLGTMMGMEMGTFAILSLSFTSFLPSNSVLTHIAHLTLLTHLKDPFHSLTSFTPFAHPLILLLFHPRSYWACGDACDDYSCEDNGIHIGCIWPQTPYYDENGKWRCGFPWDQVGEVLRERTRERDMCQTFHGTEEPNQNSKNESIITDCTSFCRSYILFSHKSYLHADVNVTHQTPFSSSLINFGFSFTMLSLKRNIFVSIRRDRLLRGSRRPPVESPSRTQR